MVTLLFTESIQCRRRNTNFYLPRPISLEEQELNQEITLKRNELNLVTKNYDIVSDNGNKSENKKQQSDLESYKSQLEQDRINEARLFKEQREALEEQKITSNLNEKEFRSSISKFRKIYIFIKNDYFLNLP